MAEKRIKEKRVKWEWQITSVGLGPAGNYCEFADNGKLKDFLKYDREDIKLAIYGGKND